MKKLLAIILCALIMILPMAASASILDGNKTECVLTLNDGTAYSFDFGKASTGEIILHVNAGGVDVDAQFGPQTAYFRAMGMLLSLEYADFVDMSELIPQTGTTSIDMSAIDIEAMTELVTKLGEDLAGFVSVSEEEDSVSVAVSFTLKELYDACGQDLIDWIQNNTDMITTIAASAGEEVTGDELLEGIGQFESIANSTDLGFTFTFDASIGEVLPNLNVALAIASQGANLIKLEGGCSDAAGFTISASAMGETMFSFAAAPDGTGAYDLILNGEKLGNIRVSAGAEPAKAFTDGSGATPILDFIKMINQMNG